MVSSEAISAPAFVTRHSWSSFLCCRHGKIKTRATSKPREFCRKDNPHLIFLLDLFGKSCSSISITKDSFTTDIVFWGQRLTHCLTHGLNRVLLSPRQKMQVDSEFAIVMRMYSYSSNLGAWARLQYISHRRSCAQKARCTYRLFCSFPTTRSNHGSCGSRPSTLGQGMYAAASLSLRVSAVYSFFPRAYTVLSFFKTFSVVFIGRLRQLSSSVAHFLLNCRLPLSSSFYAESSCFEC